ncbi:MAG: AAA family ATPase, partial [Armatimonadetes bacterium]|nr:AAA family ATPase [Armatimonadota bacterium]
ALAYALHEAHRELARLAAERGRLAQEAEALAAELAAGEQAAQDLQAAIRAKADARRAVAEQIMTVKVSLAEESAALEGLRSRLAEREAEWDALVERGRGLNAESAQLQGERQVGEQALADAQAKHRALAAVEASTREQVAQWERARGDLRARAGELEEQWHQVQAALREHEEVWRRLEVRRAQGETELSSVFQRIQEEFGLPWEAAQAESVQGMGRDEILGRIESLRGLIAALGPVNMRAIDEYRELDARVTDLRTQTEDIAAAREALLRLISHLDSVLRVRFQETFDAVNKEFTAVFQQLFGGGKAHLELVEPTTGEPGEGVAQLPLEGDPGIEILVQMPGKKLRTLAALSGGERAMTALALMFALLRVHPSPFCVFDEVEAALDDTNTRKFGALLREMAQTTQVVIITHNKGTMEVADILYGVTMQEPGVSSLVSMRLAHAPVTAAARAPEPAVAVVEAGDG